MRLHAVVLLFALGLAPALADEASCRYCYQDVVDARQRGELDSAFRCFMRGCERYDGWQKGCDNAEVLTKAMAKEPAAEEREGWSFR